MIGSRLSCVATVAVLCGLMLAVPGCPFTNLGNQNQGDQNQTVFGTYMAVSATPPASSGKIRVVFRNLAINYAVDVQFYATGNPVVDPDTDLFVEPNRVLGPAEDPIGWAGTGLIPAGNEDSIELDCAAARVIGTLGGEFVTEDTGVGVGTGTRRIAVQEQQFNCGEVITFTFQIQ